MPSLSPAEIGSKGAAGALGTFAIPGLAPIAIIGFFEGELEEDEIPVGSLDTKGGGGPPGPPGIGGSPCIPCGNPRALGPPGILGPLGPPKPGGIPNGGSPGNPFGGSAFGPPAPGGGVGVALSPVLIPVARADGGGRPGNPGAPGGSMPL